MEQKTNNLALASLVMGILGLTGFVPLLGSVMAVVLGHMARAQLAEDPSQGGEGLATGGLITGYLGLGLSCLGTMAVMVWLFLLGGLAILGAASSASASMLLLL